MNMTSGYKIVCEAHPKARYVTLLLNGKFGEEALPELERSIAEAEDARQRVEIDLSEVTLVDRATAHYFSERASRGIKLVNCPNYLRRWIPQLSKEAELSDEVE
jgi:ABC-type transporter Mla MlaB component